MADSITNVAPADGSGNGNTGAIRGSSVNARAAAGYDPGATKAAHGVTSEGSYAGSAGSDPDSPVGSKPGTAPGSIVNSKPVAAKDGSAEVGATEGSAGSAGNALGNPVTIRIYNQKGIYFETVYYPNIGFISRYEVNDAFAKFLAAYCR